MNYFELFDFPVSFYIDKAVLEERYDALRRQYQPGFSPDEPLQELSDMLDKAYLVFQDQDETIQYILKLKNLLPEEEYELSEQFLMEVRDINEELVELELDEKQEPLMNIEQKVDTLILKIYEDLASVMESYQEDSGTEETLLQVKDFY
ncbi:MAG: hypothetical protein ABIN89_20875 [Chitinophagaceae bacterium]